MQKLTLSLILSISIILLPALVQAQSFRGGGLGKASFGARGFTGSNSGSGLRGGYNRHTVPNYSGFSSRSSNLNTGLAKQPALGQTTFGSGFSGSNRTFRSGSNFRGSTLNSTLSGQSQNLIKSRRSLGKSINGGSIGSSSRSFIRSNINKNEIGTGEKAYFSSGNNMRSSFGGDNITSDFINSTRPAFTSGSNLNSTIRAARTRNFTNFSSSRNTQFTVEEIGTAPGVVSDSTTKTKIAHWIDQKSGVRHFSNSITSFRNGRETITFVNGKKVVSKTKGLNAVEKKEIVSLDSANTLSFSKNVPRTHLRQVSHKANVKNDIEISKTEPIKTHRDKGHHDKFDHHFHHHHHHFNSFFFINPFFFNPFFSFPTSTFFFGFNPFVFKALVLSPLTFRPFFAFHPFFPSALFTFHPTVSSPFLFNNFVFPSLLFPSFCNPFGFGSPFFFNQFFFAFNDFHH